MRSKRVPPCGTVPGAKRFFGRASSSRRHRVRGDAGFTLVELLITVTVAPLIIGAIAVGLVSVLSLQGGVADKITGSGDAQIITAQFEKDVQSAQYLATSASTTPLCVGGASSTQLLGLSWNALSSSAAQTVVSYDAVLNPNGTTYSLVRAFCQNGGASTRSVLLSNLNYTSSSASPTLVSWCATSVTSCVNTPTVYVWKPASSVGAVQLAISELTKSSTPTTPKVSNSYVMVASPRTGNGSTAGGAGTSAFAPLTLTGAACPELTGQRSGQVHINTATGVSSIGTVSIGTGSKTFTNVSSTSLFALGQQVNASDIANSFNYMDGAITSIVAGSSVTVLVTATSGSGSFTSWTFALDNTGVLSTQATCPGALGGVGVFAAAILTGNTGLNAYPGTIPEYYSSPTGDPFAPIIGASGTALANGLATAKSGANTGGGCSSTPPASDLNPNLAYYKTWCLPGNYTSLPAFTSPVKFEPVTATYPVYYFDAGLNLPNSTQAYFGTGTYVMGTTTGVAFTTGNNVADSITGTNVLFYAPTGDMTIQNNESVSMTGSSAYAGVSFWAGGTNALVQLGNNGAVDSYGGIYVPNGQVYMKQNGSLNVSFIVAGSAYFPNGCLINITAP